MATLEEDIILNGKAGNPAAEGRMARVILGEKFILGMLNTGESRVYLPQLPIFNNQYPDAVIMAVMTSMEYRGICIHFASMALPVVPDGQTIPLIDVGEILWMPVDVSTPGVAKFNRLARAKLERADGIIESKSRRIKELLRKIDDRDVLLQKVQQSVDELRQRADEAVADKLKLLGETKDDTATS